MSRSTKTVKYGSLIFSSIILAIGIFLTYLILKLHSELAVIDQLMIAIFLMSI